MAPVARVLQCCPGCARQYEVAALAAESPLVCSCGVTFSVTRKSALAPRAMCCSCCGGNLKADSLICEYCQAEITIEERQLDSICPACFARMSSDADFCMSCGVKIDVQVLAALPSNAACPRCRVVLRSRRVGTETLIECPSCAGLWVEPQLLERLCNDAGAAKSVCESLGAMAQRAAGAAKNVLAYIPCPNCKQPAALAKAGRPSIAVLPFLNLSGDPEQEYFADGIVEEIITALSRFNVLFVIARNSSFAYKGRSLDVRQIGRELGVAYVLEGSVRKDAGRVRISTQLVDTATGSHIWADRFEDELTGIFDLQDKVTARVVGAVAPKLETAEVERSRRKPTESLDAYDYYLRGLAALHKWTREGNDEALRHFYKSIELDADFAAAYGFAARTYVQRTTVNLTAKSRSAGAEMERLARRAAALGRDDALALSTAAFGLLCCARELDEADALLERAIQLNPNLAMAWYFSGWSKVYLGQAGEAISRLEHALELSPRDSQVISLYSAMACAHFVAGRYAEALDWNARAEREQSGIVLQCCVAAACLAQLGDLAAARTQAGRALGIFPDLRLSNADLVMFFKRPDDNARWIEGLRLADIPD